MFSRPQGSAKTVLARLGHMRNYTHYQDIEDMLKKSATDAAQAKKNQFSELKTKNIEKRTRTLENKNFFTSHVLPASSRKSQPKGLTKEFAFVLPNGTCIYQSQPTTEITSFGKEKHWERLVRTYEHQGWQVLGRSGNFLVFERLQNKKQDGLKLVKESMKLYGTLLLALTVVIFAGEWYFVSQTTIKTDEMNSST